MKYRDKATGATIRFDAAASHWKLMAGGTGARWEYSSCASVERDVPWDKYENMKGEDWQPAVDAGASPLEFKGTHGPRFYRPVY